jgi:hypothetical protein
MNAPASENGVYMLERREDTITKLFDIPNYRAAEVTGREYDDGIKGNIIIFVDFLKELAY